MPKTGDVKLKFKVCKMQARMHEKIVSDADAKESDVKSMVPSVTKVDFRLCSLYLFQALRELFFTCI